MRARGDQRTGPWRVGALLLGLLIVGPVAVGLLAHDLPEPVTAVLGPLDAGAPQARAATAGALEDPDAPVGTAATSRSRGAAGTAPDGPDGAAERSATDVGVTADEIHIGILLIDLGAVGDLGISFALNDQGGTWQPFVDEINEAGGIHGRRVVAHYRRYNPISLDDMRAACIHLTEDVGVVAVFDLLGYSRDPQLCIAQQHDTPFIWAGEGFSEGFEARAPGRFVSMPMARMRMLRNLALQLHDRGALGGRTIGILDADNPGDIDGVDGALVPQLEALGYEVAHRATLPPASDLAGAALQVSVEVQRMRSAGVDVVLLAVNALQNGQFVDAAGRQGYFPTYYTSDFATGIFEGLPYPEWFDGTLGLTGRTIGEWRTDRSEPAEDAACRERHAEVTGATEPWGSSTNVAVNYACNAIRAFAAAARAAGLELTRDSLVAGFGQVGPVALAGLGDGSFAPGKTSATDELRWVRFDVGCKCWLPDGEFAAAYP